MAREILAKIVFSTGHPEDKTASKELGPLIEFIAGALQTLKRYVRAKSTLSISQRAKKCNPMA